MAQEGNLIDRDRMLEILQDLEYDVRQERTDMEMKYDTMRLTLDALDETVIKLDGQLEMVIQVKNRLRTIPFESTLL